MGDDSHGTLLDFFLICFISLLLRHWRDNDIDDAILVACSDIFNYDKSGLRFSSWTDTLVLVRNTHINVYSLIVLIDLLL